MAWLVVVTVLVTMVSLAHGDAGHFFAELPKNLPRIGRRGDIPALVSQADILSILLTYLLCCEFQLLLYNILS